jgi:hypothetical protein
LKHLFCDWACGWACGWDDFKRILKLINVINEGEKIIKDDFKRILKDIRRAIDNVSF